MGQSFDPYLIVTVGAVLLAILASFFAFRSVNKDSAARAKWKQKATDLDHQIGEYDSIFSAYPGLILVWEDAAIEIQNAGNNVWGHPKVYGSPAALASILYG